MLFRNQSATLFLIVLVGCDSGMMDSPGVAKLRTCVEAVDATLRVISSVRDSDSALAATPKLQPTFQTMLTAMADVIEHELEHGGIQGLKPTVSGLQEDMQRQSKEIKSQMARIENLKNLPSEFWDVYRTVGADFLCALLEHDFLSEEAKNSEQVQFLYSYRNLLQDWGPARTIEMEVSNLTPSLKSKAMDRLRDGLTSDVVVHCVPYVGEPQKYTVVMGPISNFEAAKGVAQEIGMLEFEDVPRRLIHLVVDRRTLGARANSDAEEQQLAQKEREESAARMRAQMERFGEQVEQEMFGPKLPSSNDEDYHQRLVDLLNNESAHHHEEAVRRLAAMRRSEVPDRQMRIQIARGFRELARSARFPDEQELAVRGLVNWTGKQAVPTLIDMLTGSPKAPAFVLNALADHPTPKGADAVAALLGDFFNHRAAVSCLRRMGPIAEASLIRVAPSNNPDASLAAVQLLSEIGTEKSLNLLRQATRSPNPEVKAAARHAMQAVRARMPE